MPEFLTHGRTDVNSRGTITSSIVLGTIGVLAFIVQPGLVQGFVMELGLSEAEANDLAFSEMFGVAIATYLVAIAGALAAVFLETRLGLRKPIVVGIFGGAASIALLLGQPGYALFIASVGAFNFLWNFVLPFILTSVSDMDEEGDIMTHAIAMQMTGLGFGTFIAARILGLGGGFNAVLATTITLLLLSYLVLMVPIRAHDRALESATATSQ